MLHDRHMNATLLRFRYELWICFLLQQVQNVVWCAVDMLITTRNHVFIAVDGGW